MTARGSDGSRGIERILLDLFRKLNSVQIKWLVRIILKDLKLGLGHETILNLVRQLPRLLNFHFWLSSIGCEAKPDCCILNGFLLYYTQVISNSGSILHFRPFNWSQIWLNNC